MYGCFFDLRSSCRVDLILLQISLVYQGCLRLGDTVIDVIGATSSAMEARLLYNVLVISLRVPGGWGLLERRVLRVLLLTRDQLRTHLTDFGTTVLLAAETGDIVIVIGKWSDQLTGGCTSVSTGSMLSRDVITMSSELPDLWVGAVTLLWRLNEFISELNSTLMLDAQDGRLKSPTIMQLEQLIVVKSSDSSSRNMCPGEDGGLYIASILAMPGISVSSHSNELVPEALVWHFIVCGFLTMHMRPPPRLSCRSART